MIQWLAVFYCLVFVCVPCSSPFLSGSQLLVLLILPNIYAMVFISLGRRPRLQRCRFPPLFSRLSQPAFLASFTPKFPAHPRVSCRSPPLYRPQPYGVQTFFGFFSDYLLSRMESLPDVVDELISTFACYQKDHKGGTRTLLLICFNF